MKKKYSSPVFRYLDFLRVEDEVLPEHVRATRKKKSLVLGAIFLYDAFAHPLTADAGQVLIGSVCLAFCLLAVFFLVWETR